MTAVGRAVDNECDGTSGGELRRCTRYGRQHEKGRFESGVATKSRNSMKILSTYLIGS